MTSYSEGSQLKHKEDETSTSRYTLAYPELPQHLSKLVDGGSSAVEIPDYSHVSLEELTDEHDPIQNTPSIHVTGIGGEQGGYDASLDWAPEKTRLWHDSFFTTNALFRRAIIAGGKGWMFGMGVGGLVSLWAGRFMSFTQKIPLSFHVYTIGGGGFLFGGMNAVHQAKRYREYIGFKQSGVANPQAIGIKDAKNQMADWMAAAYSPEYVEQWKESTEAEEALQKQMEGFRT
eukprot:43083_1